MPTKPRYTAISQVPKAWRRLKGAHLTLPQISMIVDVAEASDKPFGEALAQARRDFAEVHKIEAGQWVSKQGTDQ